MKKTKLQKKYKFGTGLGIMLFVTFAVVMLVSGAEASPSANISGYKINSTTGSGIPGWNITLTNSTMQTSMLTGSDGSYKFSNLTNGTYNVSEETRSGFTNVTPTTVQVVITGGDVKNTNFTNAPMLVPIPIQTSTTSTFNISGYKINNTTGSGIPGWNITLKNSTMQASMPTGSDGSYKFSNLTNGTYNVSEETRSGFTNVTPTTVQVVIAGGDIKNTNFTNTPVKALTPLLTTIRITRPTVNLLIGRSHIFTAAGFDQSGARIATKVIWSSSNTNVGKIDPVTGLFKALSAGITTVTAKNVASGGTVSGTVTVKVSQLRQIKPAIQHLRQHSEFDH